jgi:hypothetical protein
VNLVVNNVYPLDGSIQGGTNLTIIGEGFGTNASLSSVSVGGVSCPVDTITDTQIKCQLAYAGRHHSVTNGGVSPGNVDNNNYCKLSRKLCIIPFGSFFLLGLRLF